MTAKSAYGTRPMKNDEGHTEGATAGDDVSGLLQESLVDRRDRDAAELEAIARAYDKYVYRARRKKAGAAWLTDELIRRVHFDMFGGIWDWGGRYRTGSTNIGVEWRQIPEQVARIIGDFEYWTSPKSGMSFLEIAARLQNRLTRVHPFKNGNGRHARLITDIFFYSREHDLPKWPQLQRLPHGDRIRKQYLSAMKKADGEDYKDLMKFIEDCLV